MDLFLLPKHPAWPAGQGPWMEESLSQAKVSGDWKLLWKELRGKKELSSATMKLKKKRVESSEIWKQEKYFFGFGVIPSSTRAYFWLW